MTISSVHTLAGKCTYIGRKVYNLELSNAPFTRLKKSSSSKDPSTGASLLKRMNCGEGRKREQGEGERKGVGERREKEYRVEKI